MTLDWNGLAVAEGPDAVRVAFDGAAKVARIPASQKPVARLVTISASALQMVEFPPIQYVVPGYICEGVTILAGKPKIGKSWMALDLALAVAFGGVALGSIQCQAGNVLYCGLEDNRRRLKRRIQQLLPNAEWPERLDLCTGMKRLNDGGLDSLRQWAESAENPRLIVVDTFACVRPIHSGKESSYEADYAAIGPLQALAGELGIAVCVVHHVRKLEAEDPLDTVSGSTGLTGAADSVLVLSRDSQGIVLYGRGRDIDEIETALTFDKVTGRWSVLGEASEVRKSDERKVIIEALGEGEMAVADLVAATGMQRNNLDQLLFKMGKAGEIVRSQRGIYGLPS
jgi:AAA domain